MTGEGYEVVLTAEGATASDSLGSSDVGFASALPDSIISRTVAKLLFPVRERSDGTVVRAPYGLAKVEAKLKQAGFNVAIVSPYSLDKAIGPNTRAVGVYTMDGLGMSYGSGITYWVLKLAGIGYSGIPYIARSFIDLLKDSAIRSSRAKVVVGGPAAWQLTDTEAQSRLGIDMVFEGEFERDGVRVFQSIVNGESIPKRFVAKPPSIEEIPPIVTPANGGMVEVTRGCGRGCTFCSPNLSGMIKSFPFDGNVRKEIELNMTAGQAKAINLHSEEFFRYGAKGIEPNPDKVLELTKNAYSLVKRYGSDKRVVTDFTTAAVVAYAPKLVSQVADYINEGGQWSFIEMGIETASPDLLERYMRGKALPYRPADYPEVVKQAIGILNDNRWIVVGTMIVGFPGENDDDIARNLELLDDLKGLRVITFPLPLVSIAWFRKKGLSSLDGLLEDPLRKEFILKALTKGFAETHYGLRIVTEGVDNVIKRYAMLAVANWALNFVEGRYRRALEELRLRMGELEKTVSILRMTEA
ncbi:radical SAM protein [Tardisphaera miroshnichenkoae]